MDPVARQNACAFLNMFDRTMTHGEKVQPRGKSILEIEDLQITVNPLFPFMSFKDRKYNVDYFKREMMWKLRADKYDASIMQYAKMWESVRNPDGTFNSNYGQFWFGEQNGFWNVVQELYRDVDSRRAVIPMLSKEHLKPETKDTVCTEAIGFRIRNKCLNMSVHMRSSDQIFGLGTDIPTFAFLYRLVYAMMKVKYPDLAFGPMTITAMSSHIYDTHYKMVSDIILTGVDGYEEVAMPLCNHREAMQIVASRGVYNYHSGALGEWLSL